MTVKNLPTEVLVLEEKFMFTGGDDVLYVALFDKNEKRQLHLYINSETITLAAFDYVFDDRFRVANIGCCEENKDYYEDCILYMGDWSESGLKDYKWLQWFVYDWNQQYYECTITLK